MKSLCSILLVLGALAVICSAVRVPIRAEENLKNARPDDNSELAKQIMAIMNTSVDPCTDFYEYTCGTWLNTYSLPPDASRFGMAFDQIQQDNLQVLREILEDPSGEWPIIGPFYNSCMDMDRRNELGITPVLSILQNFQQIQDISTLMSAVGYLHSIGINVLFSASVGVDAMNPTNNIFMLGQGGLSLDVPSDYNDPTLFGQFEQYVQQLFTLAGQTADKAKFSAQQVLAVEKALASISLSPAALRDPYATYNNLTLRELYALAPSISQAAWKAYFFTSTIAIDAGNLDVVVDVETPTFFSNLSITLTQLDWATWEIYLQYSVLNQLSASLSDDFVEANFNFFGKIYSGKKQNAPLWKRCVQQTDQSLGELLGRYYVLEHFPAVSKQMASDLVHRIEDAFLANLKRIDWMDDATRKLAAQKLGMIQNLIGYPEHWKDYSSLSISQDFFVSNLVACNAFSVADQFAQLRLPVNKGRWQMTPPTVNAYYDPTLNEMVFPAGILQSPWFFNATYPATINFAGIGSVMGHELSHGFDDQGANYDGTGKLHKWWPAPVRERFAQRTRCVADLYSTFEVLPGLYVNGNLTLGENVADIGGVHEAFTAFRTYVSSLPGPVPPILPNATVNQMFFIAHGLHWCEVDTPQALRRQVNSNPHSPARFRVNGPLSQLPDFAAAFKCPAGSPMNPTKRCNIW